MELGWPLPKRKQYLRQQLEQPTQKTHPVPFQGRQQYLAVHVVPLGLPRYRLENGRTTALQAEYLAAHPDLPEDFFRADTELEAAQKAQHNILAKLAAGPKPLLEEFKSNTQSEPIILSGNGYVVNGNRRLSVWRNLYATETAKYPHFANVEAVILPHCDDRELDRIEAELQLKEDLKADYRWTSKALMLREKLEGSHYTEGEISAVYDMSAKQVRELFDCLDYAVQYLESRGQPRQYSSVDDKEFAFRQICRTRPKMRGDEVSKELFENAAFCLADEAGEGKRIYAEIPKIADHLEEVKGDLVRELDIESEGADEETLTRRVAEALADSANFDRARETIRDTIEAQSVKKRQRKRQDFVASQVQAARANLRDAVAGIEPGSSTKGVLDFLDDVDRSVGTLRDWASKK